MIAWQNTFSPDTRVDDIFLSVPSTDTRPCNMDTLNTTVTTCAFLIIIQLILTTRAGGSTIKQLTLVSAADPSQIMSTTTSKYQDTADKAFPDAYALQEVLKTSFECTCHDE